MIRLRLVQELCQSNCIFLASAFTGNTRHNMCIKNQSDFLDSCDLFIRLILGMLFSHKLQHIIQTTFNPQI